MERHFCTTLLAVLILSSSPLQGQASVDTTSLFRINVRLWIVHIAERVTGANWTTQELITASYHNMLSSVLPSEDIAVQSIVYNYTKSFSGFAALLTPQEAANISAMPGVASIFEARNLVLHTTRSWTLLGLSSQSPQNFISELNIVTGIMDTGVWPESESFSDRELARTEILDGEVPPPPGMWPCNAGQCNGKLIDNQAYPNGLLTSSGNGSQAAIQQSTVDAVKENFGSARDFSGHGTHTASTAAGSGIRGANLSGLATGVSQGGVPGGRVASYKVCWGEGHCNDADILAAFDDSVSRGVDVLSLSFGGPSVKNLFADSIALGSFYAIQKGVVVVCSVGNDGSDLGEATNVAPWVITVGASSIDRQFYSTVVLGNDVKLKGRAINTEVPQGFHPLISGADAGLNNLSSNCSRGSLDPAKVKGKLVMCESGNHPEQSTAVFSAGGVGMIIIDDSATEIGAFIFGVPTSVIGTADGDVLTTYMRSHSSPTAQIIRTSDPLHQPWPLLASFSSRGPNRVNYGVMKPDVVAPGVSVLASWTPVHSITNEPQDHRFNESYNIASGTSIACPHVAGAAAYVKSFHPAWSAAAIKSALMTTAKPLDPGHASNGDGEFGYGSGQIEPVKAIHPGLVYDIAWEDYAEWLCGEGYDPMKMRLITGGNKTCTAETKAGDLNYPTISVPVEAGSEEPSDRWWTFTRTVTNVGAARSVYKAEVEEPVGMKVVVNPATISFSKLNEKKSFTVMVQAPGLKTSISPSIGDRLSASLVWSDGVFSVRSPIVAWIAPPPHQPWPIAQQTGSIGFRV